MYHDINKILLALLGSEKMVERWWATPNKAFDYEIPDDLWNSDRRKEVYKYIVAQVNGDYL